jgi:hypothetical protein
MTQLREYATWIFQYDGQTYDACNANIGNNSTCIKIFSLSTAVDALTGVTLKGQGLSFRVVITGMVGEAWIRLQSAGYL